VSSGMVPKSLGLWKCSGSGRVSCGSGAVTAGWDWWAGSASASSGSRSMDSGPDFGGEVRMRFWRW
jgi:hypothetical protein